MINQYTEKSLYGFPDGSISVEYAFPSTELFNECMKNREGFYNFSTDVNQKFFVGISQSKDKRKLYELIEIIDMYDSLDEIKDEICSLLEIETINSISIQESLEKALIGFEISVQNVKKVGIFKESDGKSTLTELQESLLSGFIGFKP